MGLISNGTSIFDAGAMASGFGGSMVFIKNLLFEKKNKPELSKSLKKELIEYYYK